MAAGCICEVLLVLHGKGFSFETLLLIESHFQVNVYTTLALHATACFIHHSEDFERIMALPAAEKAHWEQSEKKSGHPG